MIGDEDMDKKKYIAPDMVMLKFETDDVITAGKENSDTELEKIPI